MICIKNADIYTPYNIIKKCTILIRNKKIISIKKGTRLSEAKIIDAKGKIVCPGFIDVHLQGAGGFGVTFADQLVEIAADGINRTTTVIYFPGFDIASDFRMQLVCGQIIVLDDSVGLACPGGTAIGWTQGTPAATFDLEFEDDDVIDVNIEDANPDGNCSAGSGQVVLRFTKQ